MTLNLRKFSLLFLFALLILFLFSLPVSAAPSRKGQMLLKQPSGETFKAAIYGDENFNWVLSETGDVIVRGTDNYWYYGQLTSGKVIAGINKYKINGKPEEILKQNDIISLLKSKSLNMNTVNMLKSKGFAQEKSSPNQSLNNSNQKIITILVEFNDCGIKYSEAEWHNLIYGSSESTVKNYYQNVSGGKLNFIPADENYNIQNDGIVKVHINYNHPDPGREIGGIGSEIVKDALRASDEYVDYSTFDSNCDGYISTDELHIITVLAGYEASYGQVYGPSIWAHRSSLPPTFPVNLDGKRVAEYPYGGYTMQGEIHEDHMATIGVICHELGHDLGLYDLYDCDQSSQGIGVHSLMGTGNWTFTNGFPGTLPIGLDPWSKIKLGFIQPATVEETGDYILNSFDLDGYNVLKIPTQIPKEYFLIENRQFTGYDSGLSKYCKSGGYGIWHIDENLIEDRDGFGINDDEFHRGVDLEEANEGTLGYSQLDNNEVGYKLYDNYYYNGNNTLFYNGSVPSSRCYSGVRSNIRISSESKSTISMMVNITCANSYGDIENPVDGECMSDIYIVKGWIVNSSGVSSVDVFLDNILQGSASYGDSRRDILDRYHEFDSENCGFHYELNTRELANGEHVLKIVYKDNKGGNVLLGTKNITISNKAYHPTVDITKPFVNNTNVSINEPIEIVYDRLIEEGTGYKSITLKNPGGEITPANITIDKNKLKIRPLSNLTYRTDYTVNIPLDSIVDESGNPMKEDYIFNFTTCDEVISWEKDINFYSGDFYGSAYNGNIYVLVGQSGMIKTSEDGLNWTARRSGVEWDLNDVAWNGEKFVSAGESGTVVISFDGIEWTEIKDKSYIVETVINGTPTSVSSSLTVDIKSVTWGNGQFIAVGYYGQIWTSKDGFKWVYKYNQSVYDLNLQRPGVNLNSITWNGSRFIIAGDESPSSPTEQNTIILTSIDGDTWERVPSNTIKGNLIKVIWDGNRFIALGCDNSIGISKLLSSSDGLMWTQTILDNISGALNAIVFNGKQYFITGSEGDIYVSNDILNWSKINAGQKYVRLRTIVFNENKIIIAGSSGNILWSNDGSNWTSKLLGISNKELYSMAYNGSIYVITGADNHVYVSHDKINWNPIQISPYYAMINDIIWNGSEFIAVGNMVITSQDGMNWNTVDIGYNIDLKAIQFANGKYIAVGNNGVIITSYDGMNWVRVDAGTNALLMSIAWNGNKYVATGRDFSSGGIILTSADGGSWSIISTDSGSYMNDIIWDGTKFIGVGNNISISCDGVNWREIALANDDFFLNSIINDGKRFIAAGDFGNIAVSYDGFEWEKRNVFTYDRFNYVFSDGSQLIVLGQNGTIMYSVPGENETGILNKFNWVKNKKMATDDMYVMAYNNNIHVAAGRYGSIMVSQDGEEWRNIESNTNATFNDVIWSGREFIAVGDGGTILRSLDGIDWKFIKSSTRSKLNHAAWNGIIFVAVGENGTIITSQDGTKWETRYSLANMSLKSIVWGADKFVAIGQKGWYCTVLNSSDGLRWLNQSANMPLNTDTYYDLAWNGTKYVAVGAWGAIMSSSDGVNWTKQNSATSEGMYRVIWDGNRFAAIGINRIINTSADGETWNPKNINADNDRINAGGIYDIIWDGNRYFSCGGNGIIISSISGDNWNMKSGGSTLNKVIWGGNKFIALGMYGTMLSSLDGVQWNSENSGTWVGLSDIAWNGEKYIAVGGLGKILSSEDGKAWTNVYSPTSSLLDGIAFGNNRFVAVGMKGTVIISDDGSSWKNVESVTSENLSAVAYGNNMFTAVGSNGVLLISSDGVSWRKVVSGTDDYLESIIYANGQFIAVGPNDDTILSSYDGLSWSIRYEDNDLRNFRDVLWDGSKFVIPSWDKLMVSDDGINWHFEETNQLVGSNSIAWNGKVYVSVGENTLITYALVNFDPIDTELSIVSTVPGNSSREITVDSEIVITFSENINSGDLFDGIVLRDGDGNLISSIKRIVDNMLIIAPDKPLNYGTSYTVIIPVGAVKNGRDKTLGTEYIFSFSTKFPLYGDVDGDGIITSNDGDKVKNCVLDGADNPLTDNEIIAADVDGDGKITSTDYAIIKRRLRGK